MPLKAFDPNRENFVCKHEADAVAADTPEADALFQEGMAVTSFDLMWPEDKRDYGKAYSLWGRAVALGHWKAAMNLAGLYEQGLGVPKDTENAVQIIEGLMKRGVPAAFDRMGTFHMRGVGVKRDASRAYAFWQLAAEMGSASAQAYLGAKLDAAYDSPGEGFWGNRVVGIQMLECGYSQGSGDAAEELGRSLMLVDQNYGRALRVFHDGVKFGGEGSATALAVSFRRVESLTGNMIDIDRAKRYSLLAQALRLNPDLRFPNLDKVLPLPPAALPTWDGKRETLINAAKGLIAAPVSKPTPGAQRTGRAHIPPGHVLADDSPRPLRVEASARAPRSGYWLPQLYAAYREHERAWDEAQVPQRYEQGEAFEVMSRASLGEYAQVAARTVWHFAGEAVAVKQAVDPRIVQGIARVSRVPQPVFECRGHRPCPRTGVWFGYLPTQHPLAARYNRWDRQTYLEAGEAFPDPAALQLELAPREVRWMWCDNANRIASSGVTCVTLDDLTEAPGASAA